MTREEFKEKAKVLGFSNIEIEYLISAAEKVEEEFRTAMSFIGDEKIRAMKLVEYGLEKLISDCTGNAMNVGMVKINIARKMANESKPTETEEDSEFKPV